MSNWIKNNGTDFGKGITPDYCELWDAPLILMGIAIDSRLGLALKCVDDRVNVRVGSLDLDEIFVGNKLVSAKVKEAILGKRYWYAPQDQPEPEFSSEESEAEFVNLIKEYLKLLKVISNSELVRISPNTRKKFDFSINYYQEIEILIAELIEWADKKSIPIEKQLRAASSNNQNTALTLTTFQPQKIQRENDFNTCIAQTIVDFTAICGYPPTTAEEVLKRMEMNPPEDFSTVFDWKAKTVSIDASSPKPLENVVRTIKRQLKQQKLIP